VRAATLPLLLVLVLASGAARALPLAEFPELGTFIDEMAARHGYSPQALHELFTQVEIKPEIVAAIERPAEALPWYEYRLRFIDRKRIEGGVRYWKEHAAALERAASEFGVPPQVIVALIGIETDYGRNAGRYRVADALTTLMLQYPPRAAFFRRELEEYLLLARDLGLSPLRLKGSYAGAIGIPQFIPSSYRRYAVDFDGDGRRDLIGSAADAIGSIANFLLHHGWQRQGPVSDEVRIEGTRHFWIEQLGVKPALTVPQLVSYGIFPRRHHGAELRAALIALEGEDGPLYRIGYQNFYALTRYNRSKRYAMAVHELSELVRAAYENP
jgi:membrane-bound lytic murein transglycosylase B